MLPRMLEQCVRARRRVLGVRSGRRVDGVRRGEVSVGF